LAGSETDQVAGVAGYFAAAAAGAAIAGGLYRTIKPEGEEEKRKQLGATTALPSDGVLAMLENNWQRRQSRLDRP
jgi:hypothetical protein